jgi:hypothetical protein
MATQNAINNSIEAILRESEWDGWIESGETWTYASGTTFTITGDKTSKYTVGMKLKFTQPTDGQKYGYVKSSTYSDPDTTVTLVTNDDYDLDNEAITSPYYSWLENSNGFPPFFNFTPTWGGFSADPSPTFIGFWIQGRQLFYSIGGLIGAADGTSNATSFTVTAPLAMATVSATQMVFPTRYRDNGSNSTTPGAVHATHGDAELDCYTSWNTGNWTGSDEKGVIFSINYPI